MEKSLWEEECQRAMGRRETRMQLVSGPQQSTLELLLLCLLLKTELLFTKARMADGSVRGSVRHLTEHVQSNIPPHHSSPAFSRMKTVAVQGNILHEARRRDHSCHHRAVREHRQRQEGRATCPSHLSPFCLAPSFRYLSPMLPQAGTKPLTH